MSHWTIEIETDNAAFDDAPQAETARILRALAEGIEDDTTGDCPVFVLTDINGNRVGTARWIEE